MAASPSSSSPPPSDHPVDHDSHPSIPTPTSPPPKKTQPLPWTHQETVNLIQAYQEKWYSLKRGQLKAGQWEEVAVTVAARCGYDEPSKSAIQCRHKIEKLRKRYRAEKMKPFPHSWEYFELMDRLELGPLPISAHPLAMIKPQTSDSNNDEESDDDDHDDDDEAEANYSYINERKPRSTNYSFRGEKNTYRSNGDRVLRTPVIPKRMEYLDCEEDDSEHEEEEEEEEEAEEIGGRSEFVAELAAEIRVFADRFVSMEKRKMEMMKETERFRMELENKRMEMILQSQRKIVDTIGKAFASTSHKKMKMSQPQQI